MNRFLKGFTKKRVQLILIYNSINLLMAILLYYLIPFVLNFGPGTINNQFNIEMSNVSYVSKFIFLFLFNILIGYFILNWFFKGIDEWERLQEESNSESEKKLAKIRIKCLNTPYAIYLLQALFPSVMIIVVLVLTNRHMPALIVKISILAFSLFTLGAVVSHIFSKSIFSKILSNTTSPNTQQGIRIGLRDKIFIQILPAFIVAILFTALIGYSRLVIEKGDVEFAAYKRELSRAFANLSIVYDKKSIETRLKEVQVFSQGDSTFYISPNGEIKTSDSLELSKFFVNYIKEIADNYGGRVYDYYGTDINGAYIKVLGENGTWIVGVKYDLGSNDAMLNFIMSFMIILSMLSLILFYSSKSISSDISYVVYHLEGIAEGEKMDYVKKLSATSNDEIGDLVIAFNKIQERELDNLKRIENAQKQLLERERLVALGEMAGGIAHDLNTPLSAIQNSFFALRTLVEETKEGLRDGELNKEDHFEIMGEMQETISKSEGVTKKMAIIINSIRNQTRNLSGETVQTFELEYVVNDVRNIVGHQLAQNGCELIYSEDKKTYIKGDPGKLGQVITNFVINAMQAYDGKGGIIEIKAQNLSREIVFVVKDQGKGIPEEIKDKVFKEMLSTKGASGTGLGMYLAKSIITGNFNGKIWLESQEEQGTSVYVSIPIRK